MQINYPSRFEVYGAVKFYELIRVYSLFAVGYQRSGFYSLPTFRDLEDIASTTAIVIPVRDEDLFALEGVLRAIPIYSPVIIVSASSRSPINIHNMEIDIARSIYKTTGRTIVVIHQKDPLLGEILGESIPDILDNDNTVRYGKGEGLLLGILVADGLRASNIGFIDADNYVPGAVLEYTMIYYTVLGMSETRYKMVRIAWGYKAWGIGEFYLRRLGRASGIVNTVLNKILSSRRNIETDIVKTSNSGEHAMSMDLARELVYGGGYSVETQELVTILENCYIDISEGNCPSLPENIEIYQVETRNPHVHAEKGEKHIANMVVDSLSAIYYSKLANDRNKELIVNALRELGYEGEPTPPRRYRYPRLHGKKILDTLIGESKLSVSFGL
ncbi:MAG: mannosyl-3-phosphoglycerate synthase [Desulfurococcaceae archaeon]